MSDLHRAAAVAQGGEEARMVWSQHVRAARAGDLEGIMNDFAEGSALITPGAVFLGKAQIRSFFEKLLTRLDQSSHGSTTVHSEEVHGNTLVAHFTIASLGRTFFDTVVVRDGKFVTMSSVNYAAEPPQ